MRPFVALDFETATAARDSACAVGVVRVEEGRVVATAAHLIQPPSLDFHPGCVAIHGITPEMVRLSPHFGQLWPSIAPLFDGVAFVAAHNAAFDRSVLQACCRGYGIPIPKLPFVCTVRLARKAWHLPSAALPAVCRFLGIPLSHHDPASDALACAQIVLAIATQAPGLLSPWVSGSPTRLRSDLC